MIDELQKTILNCLNSQNDEDFLNLNGIYNYVDKNQNLPYIFYFIKNMEDLSTYSKKIYSCNISVNVYDKNPSSLYVVNMMEKIKNIFSNINNFTSDNISIIDTTTTASNILLESNNLIWKGEMIFMITFSYC